MHDSSTRSAPGSAAERWSRRLRETAAGLGLVLSATTIALGVEDVRRDRLSFFETRIRPVLVEHCYECHSRRAESPRGGLRLDSRDGIRRGGDSGPAVVPRQPEASLLLSALRHDGFEMPPERRLPASIAADFERWIRDGAEDPRREEPPGGDRGASRSGSATPRATWAFQPPRRAHPPAVQDGNWPQSPLDRFVLARLEAEGLRPNPDAPPGVLLRRLYFDLVGLPPRPEQLDEFAADHSPDALRRIVDRLLASPRFGERWGRHWLDVARFAESTGGGRTRVLENAWQYRDYVIRSWNADKPFDRFAVEQLAGDLLPADSPEQRADQLTATGFLVLGPHNYELQDKALLRMEVVDEQLGTTSRAFLGLTLDCARCHDHKFDPISTRDYYALAGFFRSTRTLTPGNVSGFVERPLPVDPEWQAALDAHAAQLEPARQRIAKLRRLLEAAGETVAAQALDPGRLAGVVVDDADAELTGLWTRSASVGPYLGSGYLHDANGGKGEKQVVFTAELPEPGEYEVRVAYTANPNRSAQVPITVRHVGGQQTVRIDQRQPPTWEGAFVSVGRFRFEREGRVVVSNEGTTGYVVADAVQWLPAAAPPKRGSPSTPSPATAGLRQELKRLEAELKRLEAQAPPPPPEVMSVEDQPAAEIGDCAICIRGNVHRPGQVVPRGFLSSIPSAPPPVARIPEGESGRRQLAEWLVRPDHPLTSRVIANRVWRQLFGRGLVATPDNFGAMGEPPTHPELLDYLAIELVRDGWSLKQLIRRIVLSRTYAMSSAAGGEGLARDPENRWWWRANRRRLDAEALRDALLAAAGELDLRMGGPTIAAGTKSEFGYRFESRRRSVYVPVFRNRLHGLFEVFDFANPNLVSGDRTTSTLPTQALYMMNSPFVMDAATQAARQLLADGPGDPSLRIEAAYLKILGRPPTDRELELASRYVESAPPAERDAAWARLCHVLFASLDFRYLD